MHARLLALVLVLAACPHPRSAPSPVAVVTRFPSLRYVPAAASYVVAAARVDQATAFLRGLQPLLRLDEPDLDLGRANANARRAIGLSPLDDADLLDNGFAVDRDAVLFGVAATPTIILPVRDRARTQAWVDRLLAHRRILSQERRGVPTVVLAEDDDLFVGFAWLEGALAIHLGNPHVDGDTIAWVDAMLDAKGGFAASPDLAWALDRAGARGELLAVARVANLLSGIEAIAADGEKLAPECRAPEDTFARGLGRLVLFGAMGEDGASFSGGGLLELDAETAGAVQGHLLPPPAALVAMRAGAAAHASVSVDLGWLHVRGAELDVDASCALGDEAYDLARDLPDQLRALGGVVRSIGLSGFRVAGEGALVFQVGPSLQPAEMASELAAALPGASQRVGGAAPTTIHSAEAPLFSGSVDWATLPERFVVAVGKGVIDRLLDGALAPAGEVLSVAVDVSRLPDLEAPFRLLSGGGGEGELIGNALRVVALYAGFSASVHIADRGLVIEAGFKLR